MHSQPQHDQRMPCFWHGKAWRGRVAQLQVDFFGMCCQEAATPWHPLMLDTFRFLANGALLVGNFVRGNTRLTMSISRVHRTSCPICRSICFGSVLMEFNRWMTG